MERQWKRHEKWEKKNSPQSRGLNSGRLLCLHGIPECIAVFERYPKMLCTSLYWQLIPMLMLMARFTRLEVFSLWTHEFNLAWNLYYVKESSERMIISPIHKYTHFRTYIIAVFVLKTPIFETYFRSQYIKLAWISGTLLSSVFWVCSDSFHAVE